MADEEPGKYL